MTPFNNISLRYGIFARFRSFVSVLDTPSARLWSLFLVRSYAGALDYAYSEVTAVDWRYESSAKNAEEEEVQFALCFVSLYLSISL
jgi:hypothetical protein